MWPCSRPSLRPRRSATRRLVISARSEPATSMRLLRRSRAAVPRWRPCTAAPRNNSSARPDAPPMLAEETQLLGSAAGISGLTRSLAHGEIHTAFESALYAVRCAQQVVEAFLDYNAHFRAITRRAPARFAARDWRAGQE